jgi:hypothetical protein
MSLYPLPIETFIARRLDELGIRPAELTERCGIRKARTGLRVLLDVYRGEWQSERARTILRNLPAALGVEDDAAKKALTVSDYVGPSAEPLSAAGSIAATLARNERRRRRASATSRSLGPGSMSISG